MGKVNVSLQKDVYEDLLKLVPPRKRSEVINEALRKELLHRKRELAAARIKQLRKRSATLNGREIVEAVRKDRSRAAT
jgi:metal-responsive CopG/Arc/MetJ family transcriptional regulator